MRRGSAFGSPAEAGGKWALSPSAGGARSPPRGRGLPSPSSAPSPCFSLRPSFLLSRFHGGPACFGAQRLKSCSCEVRLAGEGFGEPAGPPFAARSSSASWTSPGVCSWAVGSLPAGQSWWPWRRSVGGAGVVAYSRSSRPHNLFSGVDASGCPCPLSRSCRPGEKAAPRIISSVSSCH